jgi:Uma2 family endonuclease
MVIRGEHRVTDDEFYQFCADNPDLRAERTAEGDLIVMPPPGTETGRRNMKLSIRLGSWAERDGRGQAFDSSTGYTLPNTAVRSPDASWVLNSRYNALTTEEKRGHAPLCPDFVVELMSPTDRLSKVQAKMREWMDNGAQLGWLLDPDRRTAYIYRPGRDSEQSIHPDRLLGEGPVTGFVLDLAGIWPEE